MSAKFLVLAALVAAPSSFAVGLWQGEHADVGGELSTVQVNAPSIARPGAGSADAVRYLAGLTAPPAPPPSLPSSTLPTGPRPGIIAPPPGPPPVDVAVQFRRDVTAVITGSEPHVVLASGRRLRRGEVYRDGWRVGSLSSQQAVLTKGRESRNINLFSAPPVQETVQFASAAPLMTGPVSLSNGMTAEERAARLQQMQMQMRQGRGGRGEGRNNGGPNGGFGGRNFNSGNFNGGNFNGGGGFQGGGAFNQGGQRRMQVQAAAPPSPPPPPPPPPPAPPAPVVDD